VYLRHVQSLAVTVKEVSGAVVGGLLDKNNSAGRKVELIGGFLASGVRLTAGMTVGRIGPRPEKRLTLWDFERCPHSRSVREALSMLDLDADVRPCPRGGTRFRPELEGSGVPRLEDPNATVTLSGSSAIIAHLYAKYGAGSPPPLIHFPLIRVLSGISVRLLTFGRGRDVRPSRAPEKPLELWSFEASPYCRLVRAKLTELELPYVLHNCAKGSPRRAEFIAFSGRRQFPFLYDPNSGAKLFESLAIEQYLVQTYGLG
jgi:glutathione S-transferase